MAIRRREQQKEMPVSDAILSYLRTGDWPEGDDDGWFEVFDATADDGAGVAADWMLARRDVLADWIREHPGTRPAHWWQADAPEPVRRRIGGTGDDYSKVGWDQSYRFGFPRWWFDRWIITYYNGAGVDVNGRPAIGTDRYRPGDFPHTGVDPLDPPRFESQASYLLRHGLLSEDERKRLPANAFEPEPIDVTGLR